jgi:DHA2 family multidrug resistance protein
MSDTYDTEWRPSHSPWLITLAVLLATFMEVLDTSIANVALPHIAGSLSASVDEATWVLTSYLVANAIILPAASWLSMRFGRKRYLAFSVLMFTAASAFCGMAQTLPQIIVARIFQGLGGGGLQPLVQAILLESFPKEKRGPAMAAYGMGIVVAPIIGPTLGGWITDNFSWRWIFYINIPIGFLGLMMQSYFLEDPPYIKHSQKTKIDTIGLGLMAVWIGLLQIVLDRGQEADWFGASWIRTSTAVIIVSLVFFVIWELRQKHPMVNLKILRNRNFAMATVLITVVGSILYGTTVILPIFMQNLLRYTAYISGLAMTPRGIGSFFSMLIIGRLVTRFDARMLMTIGFIGIALSCWYLSRITMDITRASISWPLVLNGLSMGFIFVPMTTLSVATLKQQEIHQATGIYSLMRNIGGSFGISVLISLQARGAQVHQAYLSSHLAASDPIYRGNLFFVAHALRSLEPHTALQTARVILYNQLLNQSALLAIVDTFHRLMILSVCCIPLVFLFRRSHVQKITMEAENIP